MQHLIDTIRQLAKKDQNMYPNADLNDCIIFGVRGHNSAQVNVGEMLAKSYEWIDNEHTDNKLDGTCAVKVEYARNIDDLDDAEIAQQLSAAIKAASSYHQQLLLVFGIDTKSVCNDDFSNEIIIDDCTVAAII